MKSTVKKLVNIDWVKISGSVHNISSYFSIKSVQVYGYFKFYELSDKLLSLSLSSY